MSEVQPTHRLGCLCEDCLPPAPVSDEWPKVEAWRMDQLLRAGYSVGLASQMAERGDIDLHYACELAERVVAQGLEPALAALIVL